MAKTENNFNRELGYMEIILSISQNSTEPPRIITLKNDTGSILTADYVNTGTYTLTSSIIGLFDEPRTFPSSQVTNQVINQMVDMSGQISGSYFYIASTTSQYTINSFDNTGSLQDGMFNGAQLIIIRIYDKAIEPTE